MDKLDLALDNLLSKLNDMMTTLIELQHAIIDIKEQSNG